MNHLNRRDFVRASSIATGVVAAGVHSMASETTSSSPNERIVVGVMGLQRGQSLVSSFAGQPNTEVGYLCDVDKHRLENVAKRHKAQTGKGAKSVTDFREILDDSGIDVLVCAAPNHWHAPATIIGCNAGKHVYVEKPCSHNPHEGELMVQAARKHKRCVQMGSQRRSNQSWRKAVKMLHEGAIGRVYLARAWYSSLRGSVGTDKFIEVPDYLNYELWQGPAPRKPYSPAVVHYNWHWRWHWGNGELGNNGVHTLDLCRWGLGVDYPTMVTSEGGRYAYDDAQETPDTHTVNFSFADNKSISWMGLSCNRHSEGFINFYGTEGTMAVGPDGATTVYDRNDRPIPDRELRSAGDMQNMHIANFLDAIRSDNPSSLNSEIEIGHKSTLLCHLGNISHRVGRTLYCDDTNGHIQSDDEAMAHWKREYEPGWEPKVS
ncbi:MAG: Gfo/Idh/MocA family oxidoreductase [Planctomycetales bacterium]|nr:Gfo/Idh/MocA family oxidoreductase [Planctomycetales bacterium]